MSSFSKKPLGHGISVRKSVFAFPKKEEPKKNDLYEEIKNKMDNYSLELNNGQNMFSFFLSLMTVMDTPEKVSIELQALINITHTFLLQNVQSENSVNIEAALKMLVMLVYLNVIVFLHNAKDFEKKFIEVNTKLMEEKLFEKLPHDIMGTMGTILVAKDLEFSRSLLPKSYEPLTKQNNSNSLNELLCTNTFHEKLYKGSILGEKTVSISSKEPELDDIESLLLFGIVPDKPFKKFMLIYFFPSYLVFLLGLIDKMSSKPLSKKSGGMKMLWMNTILIMLFIGIYKVEAKIHNFDTDPKVVDLRKKQSFSKLAQFYGFDSGPANAIVSVTPRVENVVYSKIASVAAGIVAYGAVFAVGSLVAPFVAPIGMPYLIVYLPMNIGGALANMGVVNIAAAYAFLTVAVTNDAEDQKNREIIEMINQLTKDVAAKDAAERSALEKDLSQINRNVLYSACYIKAALRTIFTFSPMKPRLSIAPPNNTENAGNNTGNRTEENSKDAGSKYSIEDIADEIFFAKYIQYGLIGLISYILYCILQKVKQPQQQQPLLPPQQQQQQEEQEEQQQQEQEELTPEQRERFLKLIDENVDFSGLHHSQKLNILIQIHTPQIIYSDHPNIIPFIIDPFSNNFDNFKGNFWNNLTPTQKTDLFGKLYANENILGNHELLANVDSLADEALADEALAGGKHKKTRKNRGKKTKKNKGKNKGKNKRQSRRSK